MDGWKHYCRYLDILVCEAKYQADTEYDEVAAQFTSRVWVEVEVNFPVHLPTAAERRQTRGSLA